MSKYDYYIDYQRLKPPLDEKFPYTAFVDYIYEVTEVASPSLYLPR